MEHIRNNRLALKTVTLAHSADSDDAFMFHALFSGKINTAGLKFQSVISDIETLNSSAKAGRYDITALSAHAYVYSENKYKILTCGASVGDGYGPILISKNKFTKTDLKNISIAIPGKLTTAYLILKLFAPKSVCIVKPFDKIMECVINGEFDAGLIIHEGQLTYKDHDLHKIIDLGKWWQDQFSLPLVLGLVCVKRSLDAKAAELVYKSIKWSLDYPKKAIQSANVYSRGMSGKETQKFVSMYVNGYTLNLNEAGKKSIAVMYDLGFKKKLIPRIPKVEFVNSSHGS